MLLDSHDVMKAGNLAEILETSERTIYRDIDILCEAGLPIMSISGPNGGYSFMDNCKIGSNTLESKDVINLLISSMGIKPEKNTETAQQLKNAVIKLENSVSDEHREELIKAKESFFIDSEPWWGKRVPNEYIDVIKNSVLNLKKLKIYYKKYTGEISERIIQPYGVVVKNSEWYVSAFCEEKNDLRVFKCSRIQKVEVINENFSIPSDFNLKEFWEKSKHQFIKKAASNTATNSYTVKIKFNAENLQLLKGFHINSSVKSFDSWIYTLDMISFETACSVLFPLSDRLEILEPFRLKDYIIKKANKILNFYKVK